MVYRATLLVAILTVFSASFLIRERFDEPMRPEVVPYWQCQRIVSMAPSITETLYALGLGDRVVGVTRFCQYPPEVNDKPRIGGYYDPNFEAILALKPDLIIMLEEHEQSLRWFEKLKIETLVVSHKTVNGIIESFRTIGRVCGKGAEGRRMANQYERQLEWIREKTESLQHPRVLLSLDRAFGRGYLADVYIVGADDYFDRIIELAGGVNAYRESKVRYPVVSSEGILWLNPDVIVDLAPKSVVENIGREEIAADWDELPQIEAVKSHRVFVFDQDYAFVPGPRFLQLVEELAKKLHPEVKWDETNWKMGGRDF
jgi:iron complex transport system substrate-binding protein